MATKPDTDPRLTRRQSENARAAISTTKLIRRLEVNALGHAFDVTCEECGTRQREVRDYVTFTGEVLSGVACESPGRPDTDRNRGHDSADVTCGDSGTVGEYDCVRSDAVGRGKSKDRASDCRRRECGRYQAGSINKKPRPSEESRGHHYTGDPQGRESLRLCNL